MFFAILFCLFYTTQSHFNERFTFSAPKHEEYGLLLIGCLDFGQRIEAGECLHQVNEFAESSHISLEDCRNIQECVESSCLPAHLQLRIGRACEELELRNTEFFECLVNLSNQNITENSCLGNKSDTFGEASQELFTTKKNCIKVLMKDTCGDAAVEDFDKNSASFIVISNRLEQEKILSASQNVTSPPALLDNCTSSEKTEAENCLAMLTDFSTKLATLGKYNEINDSKVLGLIDDCQEIQKCSNSSCLTEEVKKPIELSCNGLRLRNTEFSQCLRDLPLKANFSQYSCVLNFKTGAEKLEIQLLTTQKECTKVIMNDTCGEKSIEDFDRNSEMLLSTMNYSAIAGPSVIETTPAPPQFSNCTSQAETMEALKCLPMITQLSSNSLSLGDDAIEGNTTKIQSYLKTCGELQTCMATSCLSTKIKDSVKLLCQIAELGSTGFLKCLNLVEKQNPEKYASCQNQSAKNECMKKTMKDVCGGEGIQNFDNDMQVFLNISSRGLVAAPN